MEKEKGTPVAGIPWLRFWIFDVTKNVTKWVKIGVNQCNTEAENRNILLCKRALLTRYCGFRILVEVMGIYTNAQYIYILCKSALTERNI